VDDLFHVVLIDGDIMDIGNCFEKYLIGKSGATAPPAEIKVCMASGFNCIIYGILRPV
jgi:hypothetical protein